MNPTILGVIGPGVPTLNPEPPPPPPTLTLPEREPPGLLGAWRLGLQCRGRARPREAMDEAQLRGSHLGFKDLGV